MFRRVVLFSVLFGTACASGDAGTAGRSGRLLLTREAPGRRTLLDRPATARYCDRDSTLFIVATSDAWSAAVAMRSAWPIGAAASFAVAPALGAVGSGAVAARALTDSILPALVGGSGTITVTPDSGLAGHFAVDVPRDSGATIHLTGRFGNLAVGMDGCP